MCQKIELPVTVTLWDSIMKEVIGWDLSDENNKVTTTQFSGAATDGIKSYIQPKMSNNPEFIVLHCGTNDLRQDTGAVEIGQEILELTTSCKSVSSNIWKSGIFPRRHELNAKTAQFSKNECGKRNVCFIKNSNIKPRYHCNLSGIHVSKSETNMLIENFLFVLSKFECWHKAQVSMAKNAKETFKTLRGLRSKHRKNVFLGHFNVNSSRNKFESLNELIKDTFEWEYSWVRVNISTLVSTLSFGWYDHGTIMRHCNMDKRQISVETALCISTLEFTTLSNVKSTMCISMLQWITLDNFSHIQGRVSQRW